MKKKIIYVFLLFLSSNVFSQKHDYNWILGKVYGYDQNGDKFPLKYKNIIHFNNNTIDYIKSITSENSEMSSYNLTASDSMGKLIFYFNGLRFFNRKHKIMQNGDSIGYDFNSFYWWVSDSAYHCFFGDDVEDVNYTQKFIPFPDHENQYLVFFSWIDRQSIDFLTIDNELAYVRIDMEQDGGYGAVIEKNNLLIDGYMEGIGLVKHANGRDWWMVTSAIGKNIFYIFYINKYGINGPKKVEIEPKIDAKGMASAKFNMFDLFSPDGKLFVKIQLYKGLFLYNFDRCTGEMTFNRWIKIDQYIDRIAFSPDSRFIYFTSNLSLFQLDLHSDDTKYRLIGPMVPSSAQLQLGPDGKIYFSFYFTDIMGYINRPNLPGEACDVRVSPIKMPQRKMFVLPQYPNYRLEAIENENCPEIDTVFQPYGAPVKYTFNNKEYIMSNRYRMLKDSSYYDMLKISE